MAKGTLGIILCPMLEDELLHYVCNDSDIGRIVLLDNEYCGSIRAKLEAKGTRFEFLPEADFDEGRLVFDGSIYNVVIKTNDLALHAEPDKLKEYIQNQIVDMQPLVDAIGLYYGMCGNFGWDITEWCSQKGYKPTAMFRGLDGKVCDDCVAVAIGGSSQYLALVKKYTGMFFITPAIANNWVDFVKAGDIGKGLSHIPLETLHDFGIYNEVDYIRWMFEVGHYEHTLLIDTGLGDSESFNVKANEISETLRLKPLIIEDGWVTIDCAEAIYSTCKGFLEQGA